MILSLASRIFTEIMFPQNILSTSEQPLLLTDFFVNQFTHFRTFNSGSCLKLCGSATIQNFILVPTVNTKENKTTVYRTEHDVSQYQLLESTFPT